MDISPAAGQRREIERRWGHPDGESGRVATNCERSHKVQADYLLGYAEGTVEASSAVY